MKWDIITAKEAPAPPRSVSAGKELSMRVVTDLKKGDVAVLTPEEGETLNGLTISLKRAATELKKPIMTYKVDERLYAKLV